MKTEFPGHSDAKATASKADQGQSIVPDEVVEQARWKKSRHSDDSIKVGTVAQIVIALIATLGLLFLLKLVLVAILASILLAYVLEPVVALLVHWRSPRWLAAMIVIAMTVLLALGTPYFSYNAPLTSPTNYLTTLPRYVELWVKSERV